MKNDHKQFDSFFTIVKKPQTKTFMKKVHFCEKPTIYFMTDRPKASREARKSNWMKIAQDRHRFKRRIRQTGQQIEWCLTQSHREKIRVLCAF